MLSLERFPSILIPSEEKENRINERKDEREKNKRKKDTKFKSISIVNIYYYMNICVISMAGERLTSLSFLLLFYYYIPFSILKLEQCFYCCVARFFPLWAERVREKLEEGIREN